MLLSLLDWREGAGRGMVKLPHLVRMTDGSHNVCCRSEMLLISYLDRTDMLTDGRQIGWLIGDRHHGVCPDWLKQK